MTLWPRDRVGSLNPTAARVAHRLRQLGLDVAVTTLDGSTRTATLTAEALEVEPGQIVKSLVFLRDGAPVIVLCAGDRRVKATRLGLSPASAAVVREVTGFPIGGVPPLGFDRQLETLIDESLLRFPTVWATAGTPRDVFAVETEALIAAIQRGVVTSVS